MKTKLFFGLALLAALSTACEPDREQEITRPHLQPLTAYNWADLEAPDTQIEVFDQLRLNGSMSYGLQQIRILHRDESRKDFFTASEIEEFYEAYPTEVFLEDQSEAPTQQRSQDEPFSKTDWRDEDRPRKYLDSCRGVNCQGFVQKEIKRLQKIARQNCLSMLASFYCCQGEGSQEIMVYLTPGVHCERDQLSQKITAQKSITH